jgi:hypothetical protein
MTSENSLIKWDTQSDIFVSNTIIGVIYLQHWPGLANEYFIVKCYSIIFLFEMVGVNFMKVYQLAEVFENDPNGNRKHTINGMVWGYETA